MFISENAILDIIYFNIKNFRDVVRIGKTKINISEEGILIQISLSLKYGKNIPEIVRIIQENLKKELDFITGINIQKIDVLVEDLIIEKHHITDNIS